MPVSQPLRISRNQFLKGLSLSVRSEIYLGYDSDAAIVHIDDGEAPNTVISHEFLTVTYAIVGSTSHRILSHQVSHQDGVGRLSLR
jgi:hypothetical protein